MPVSSSTPTVPTLTAQSTGLDVPAALRDLGVVSLAALPPIRLAVRPADSERFKVWRNRAMISHRKLDDLVVGLFQQRLKGEQSDDLLDRLLMWNESGRLGWQLRLGLCTLDGEAVQQNSFIALIPVLGRR